MAWYGVTYACGCSDRMQVYGPTRDRQAIADREGRKDCPTCYRKAQDARNAAATVAAAQEAVVAGMPTLIGSTKQISWAEMIRATTKQHIETAIGQYDEALAANSLMSTPQAMPPITDVVGFGARILRQADAKYWIDRRSTDFRDLRAVKQYLVRRASEEAAKVAGAKILAAV